MLELEIPSWLLKTKKINYRNCPTFYQENLDKKLGIYTCREISFNDLREEVIQKNIKSFKEYKKQAKKYRWPISPHTKYKDEWISYNHLFGKEEKEHYVCREISFKQLMEEVKQKGINSFKQYRKCYKEYGWPSSPHVMYEEWISFNHLFGKEENNFLPYEDLVKEVRSAGITSMIQYHKYRKQNNKKNWHSNPHKLEGWTNNFNFFGKKKDFWSKKGLSSYKDLKTLEQIVKEMKENGIKTRKEYRKNCKKFGWPANPDDAYKDCWKGWDYLFSREKKIDLSWEDFVSQVREAKIKGFWDYRNRYKNYKGWPSQPMNKYSENWVSWMHLLDKNYSKKNSENYKRNEISWEELKSQVKEAGIKNSKEYRNKYKEYGWTSSPQKSYPENWTNWDNFLDRKNLTFAQLKKEVKLNKIKDQVEYRRRYKDFEGWPSNPESVFKNEWKDWYHFLSKPRDKHHPKK